MYKIKPCTQAIHRHKTTSPAAAAAMSRSDPLTPPHAWLRTVRPKRPEYSDYDTRLATFSTWPLNTGHSPERLARAGFFYTGDADCTRCFCCGGAVRHWLPADDEWLEHARHFPRCDFLMERLGQEVVDVVVALNGTCDQVRAERNRVKDALQIALAVNVMNGNPYPQITVDMVRNVLWQRYGLMADLAREPKDQGPKSKL
ncbi:hypothetical protein EGW08_009572 [Elysia chlorotica]|uniref:Uncharacterized protein n=1 Tax=Elysia chlorotica TaxID=188477 RepID=A0A3S1B903_ELYCH|nr:hypothetical protein EGW08_009572 [Elysia chlorotica]